MAPFSALKKGADIIVSDVYKTCALLNIPIHLYKSLSGKTFYAQISLTGNYERGESKASFDEAIKDLQEKINIEYCIKEKQDEEK